MRIYDAIETKLRAARVPAARALRPVQHRSVVHDRRGHRFARAPRADQAIGMAGCRAADVPARSGHQPAASAAGRRRSSGWQRQTGLESVTSYASYIQALENRRAVLQDSRAPRPPTTPPRPRSRPSSPLPRPTSLFQRALAGRATAEDARAVHRTHADRDGADEHRGRARHAAPSGLGPEPQRSSSSSASVRTAAATSRWQRSTRATSSRCSTSTATIRG